MSEEGDMWSSIVEERVKGSKRWVILLLLLSVWWVGGFSWRVIVAPGL